MVPLRSSGIYVLALTAPGCHKYFRTISKAGRGEGIKEGRGLGPSNNKERFDG